MWKNKRCEVMSSIHSWVPLPLTAPRLDTHYGHGSKRYHRPHKRGDFVLLFVQRHTSMPSQDANIHASERKCFSLRWMKGSGAGTAFDQSERIWECSHRGASDPCNFIPTLSISFLRQCTGSQHLACAKPCAGYIWADNLFSTGTLPATTTLL